MTPTAPVPAASTPAATASPAAAPAALTQGDVPASRSGGHAGQGPSLAGTYLNQFNQMVELIERLPDTPELIDDLLTWQPMSYQDYFAASAMPGRVSAADVYAALNRCVRQRFEGVVDDLDRKALGAVAVIRRHYKTHGEDRPDIMMEICARAGTHLREALGKANALVGQAPGGAGSGGQGRRLQAAQA